MILNNFQGKQFESLVLKLFPFKFWRSCNWTWTWTWYLRLDL